MTWRKINEKITTIIVMICNKCINVNVIIYQLNPLIMEVKKTILAY